ncbi:MAG: Gfo/Idh/MocA family oxidoreductase [Caldilineaceae bacterium]|nr:Gfo/Idh/MocA family oxidoreductase [Caldilineaceae bacterium]MDE0337462.1 Gfo/Idh/MocA family oxidoreductase [Caldilineaceae bacterium]
MDLSVGLIGYGNWTRMAYLPAMQRDGRARTVSAAAPSAATQQRITSELGPEVAVYSNAADLLEGPPVDAVFIAVSDAAHEEALTAALDAGVPMFYEPPLSNRRQRIRPMVARLLKAQQVTHADLEIGFIPVFIEAARRVRDGVFGQVHTASVRLQSNWGADPEADLSTLNHIAPWYVDTLNRILDATPSRVLLLEGEGLPGRAQRQCQGLYDYGGTWGTVQVNLGCVVELETTVEVNGEDGDLVVDLFSGELRQRTRGQSDWSVETIAESEPRAGWPGMNECVALFLDTVTGEPLAEAASEESDVDALRGKLGTGPLPADAKSVAQLHMIGLAAEASKDSGGWAEIEEIHAP